MNPPLSIEILHRRYTITKVTCIDVLEWDDLVPLAVDEAISQRQVCPSDQCTTVLEKANRLIPP